MHPAQPLHGKALFCGESFDTSVVQEALKVRRELTYGVVVIDGEEATLGTLQAQPTQGRPEASKLTHLVANIASRTRRGGQSAARYSRNRDVEKLAFLRKVAEAATKAFSDVHGLIVGGRGDMKRKMVAELPGPLRGRVTRVVELQCRAGVEGLQKAAAHVGEAAASCQRLEAEEVVSHFLELVAQSAANAPTLVCYGEAETLAALRIGAVDQLLLAGTSPTAGSRGRDEWSQLAAALGAAMLEVDPKTDAALHFCKGFGVGARLRYPVDPALLEETSDDELGPAPEPQQFTPGPAPEADSDCESVSTATSQTDALLRSWLQAALKVAMQDTATAESLTACVDVVLFDETTRVEERLEATLEMLRAEGVPEEVLIELACHVADHFSTQLA